MNEIPSIDTFTISHPFRAGIADRLHIHSLIDYTPRRSWLVPDLIARGELSVLFGQPGSGKSTLAVDLACRLVAGFGWDGSKVEYEQTVLYIAAERPDQVRRRADAFCKRHGLDGLARLAIYDGALDLSRASDEFAWIVETARQSFEEWEIDLVVIDTLAAAMSAPDSSTDATAAVVANISRARQFLGPELAPHVMLVTHTPLADPSRPRGGHLMGAADVAIHVTAKAGISTARVIKDNESEKRASFSYRIESEAIGDDGETAAVVVPVESKPEAPKDAKLPKAQQAALDALVAAVAEHGGAVDEAAWRAALAKARPDMKPDAVRMAVKRAQPVLEASSHIQKCGGLWKPAQAERGI